jgi:hypothetical protein
MPLWSGALLLLLLANAGMPATVGFLGEAGLVWGCLEHFPWVGLLTLPAMGLMGLRSLLLYAQLCWGVAPGFMGPLPLFTESAKATVDTREENDGEALLLLRHWDVTPQRDGAVLLLLAVLGLLLGIWPQPLLQLLEETALLLTGHPEEPLDSIPMGLLLCSAFYRSSKGRFSGGSSRSFTGAHAFKPEDFTKLIKEGEDFPESCKAIPRMPLWQLRELDKAMETYVLALFHFWGDLIYRSAEVDKLVNG